MRMIPPLPPAYWAHLDHIDADGQAVGIDSEGRPAPHSFVASSPDVALEWMRESVRGALLDLDRAGFDCAWGWLGNHRAADASAAGLFQGRPVRFAVTTPSGRWSWSAAPVGALLPLAGRCPASLPSSHCCDSAGPVRRRVLPSTVTN
ncbi:hypothetical protein [Streptomyces sp. NPDC059080]|uniref:hypothetical protein n=1 Tax=Streptomyces sp. NPDC059080 TaxID=3346718 RepID=UPI00369CD6C5